MNEITDFMLTSPAGALIKTTLVDYPGLVACSFFLKGCNLRCPYCYNKGLVLGGEDSELTSAAVVLEHLRNRKGLIEGFVLSGGEPLLNPLTPFLIQKSRMLGYKIKLDTNGTLPKKLERLISDPSTCPDFIAMDIKTSPERYNTIVATTKDRSFPFNEKIRKSIELISSFPADSREFRTVLVPEMVGKKDIANIAALLPQGASWQFAQFSNKNCINPEYDNKQPYLDSEINDLVSYAQSFIPTAIFR